MSNRSSNRAAVPEAKSALDRFKYEVAVGSAVGCVLLGVLKKKTA